MASEETIETRLISGTGLVRIPNDKSDRRLYTLFAQVVRPPRSPYLNLKSSPAEGFYGKITCVKDDVVYKIFPHEFDSQAWEFIPDISAQNLIAIKCMYQGILITFQNLGFALQTPPITYVNTINDYKPVTLPFNEFRVVCYADSAIKFTLKAIPYDACSNTNNAPQEPPSIPTPPTQVSPDTPLDISAPYAGDTTSKKATIDESFTPPPLGGVCESGTLRWIYDTTVNGNTQVGLNGVTNCYGPVSRDFRLKPGEANVLQTEHRGNPFLGGCSNYEWRDIMSLGSGNVISNWRSITFPE